jgi:hypothetical protein
MIKLLFCLSALFHQIPDTSLKLNGRSFNAGDSLIFSWNGHLIHKGYPLATMHLWIDNVETGQRWKLRYPIINGEAEGAMAISDSLPAGTYAFNFLGAENFLEIYGKMRKVKLKLALNHETKKMDTIAVYDQPGPVGMEMGYTFVGRQGVLYDSVLRVGNDGSFKIPAIVFGDTARLVFTPEKEKSDYLIDMITPLDTAFTPFYVKTVFIQINKPEEKVDTTPYSFNIAGNYPNSITLEEVKISGPSKAKKFEKEYVSPQFRSMNARTLNALDNDDLMHTNSIWDYLRANSPGMMISNSGWQRSAMWRGQKVSFFLDEVLTDINAINVQPMDVALIKVYPPPSMISSQVPGGAVAIYTKRGGEHSGPPSKYNYVVMGYTQGEILWK